MIEVVTPLITKSPHITTEYLNDNDINVKEYLQNPAVVQELHMFYHNLAFFRNHLYVGIPNEHRDTEKIKRFVEEHPALKALLNE